MEIILLLAVIAGSVFAYLGYAAKKRREYLLSKYGDASVVEMIMQRKIWQGMTEEQLIDSWGQPSAKDNKVYKTKTTQIFKYNQTGKNRFANRVRVDNCIVVGWEQK